MDSGLAVGIVSLMSVVFGALLRIVYIRHQRELIKERSRSEVAITDAQASARERDEQSRLRVIEAEGEIKRNSAQNDTLILLVRTMEDRDQRADRSAQKFQSIQLEQLDALREVTATVKLQNSRLTSLDIMAEKLQTDLGETRNILRDATVNIPKDVASQFSPVALSLSAILIKIDGAVNRIMDWDRESASFMTLINTDLLQLKADAAGMKADIQLVREALAPLYAFIPQATETLETVEETVVIEEDQTS